MAELTGLAPALACAGLLHAGPALTAVCASSRRALGVGDRVADRGGVALTFDDGPDRRGTPAILEALARESVAGTFFLVGEQVRERPALAREIRAAGHAIALHADRHRNLLRLGPAQTREDLRRAHAAIGEATGVDCTLHRPPYGILNGAAWAYVHRAGWRSVLWTRWGRDWHAAATAASIARLAASGLGGGEVVLLHDSDRYGAPGCWRATRDAVPRIVELVRQAGLRPVALGRELTARRG